VEDHLSDPESSMSHYEAEARKGALEPYSSPLHRPLPAVAITSWSELSSALQPASIPHAHGRTSNASSSSRPKLHASVSQPGASTSRFSPYTVITGESPTKASRKRATSAVTGSKAKASGITEINLLPGVRDARTEEERRRNIEKLANDPSLLSARAVCRLDPSPSRQLSASTFPHVIEFEELPTQSGVEPTLGVSIRSVLDGRAKVAGGTDRVLKHWNKEMLLLTVPVSAALFRVLVND